MTLEVANETEGPTTFFTQIIARLRFVLPFLMSLQLTYNLKFIIIRLKIKYKQYDKFTFQNKSSATFVAQVVPFHTVSNQQVALHPGLFNQLVAHFAWHHGIFKTKEKKKFSENNRCLSNSNKFTWFGFSVQFSLFDQWFHQIRCLR